MEKNLLIEEYKTLRQEILDLAKAQNDLIPFTFTAVSAIYAFAINSNNPYLYLISFIILIPVRCRHIYYHESVIKIATYICCFIESNIEELNWESRCHSSLVEPYIHNNNKKGFYFSNLHYFLYTIIAFCTSTIFCIHIIRMLENKEHLFFYIMIIILSILLSFCVFLLDFILIKKSRFITNLYNENWNRINHNS